MNMDLTLYNFKANLFELKPQPDEIILDLISRIDTKELVIIKIFTHLVPQIAQLYNFSDIFNYFYELVKQINKLVGNIYSEDDLHIYALYAIPTYQLNDIEGMTLQLEKILNLTPSNDYSSYISLAVKYKLLYLYSQQIDKGKFTDMKKLLGELNAQKNFFDTIGKEIDDLDRI